MTTVLLVGPSNRSSQSLLLDIKEPFSNFLPFVYKKFGVVHCHHYQLFVDNVPVPLNKVLTHNSFLSCLSQVAYGCRWNDFHSGQSGSSCVGVFSALLSFRTRLRYSHPPRVSLTSTYHFILLLLSSEIPTTSLLPMLKVL